MKLSISKKDREEIIEQSKQVIVDAEVDINIAKESERRAKINIVTAKAIIKTLAKE